jgi:S-formylglutathione hydrolase
VKVLIISIQIQSEQRCFGGVQGVYSHRSEACAGTMKFGVFAPPQASVRRVPVIYFLSGLTCTEETFAIKAGAQRIAADLGVMLVTPDTSPREPTLPGDRIDWDFGIGAGFYVDATQAPWSQYYRMFSYVTEELPRLIARQFSADTERQGILGHSMGGHGAIICAFRQPDLYRSVSAFAPICAPMRCAWGEKAFARYLGDDRDAWSEWDSSELAKTKRFDGTILIDQGTSDSFLATQLHPELLEAACRTSKQKLTLRRHEGYDHSYYFIETFVEDHLRHHVEHFG